MKYLPYVLQHLKRNRIRTASTLAGLALCIFVFAEFRQTRVQVLNAILLGFLNVQFGFIMHDAGHRQIFHLAPVVVVNVDAGCEAGLCQSRGEIIGHEIHLAFR